MEWDFSELKVGKIINVQAYKHNGFLYRQWNGAKVIFHNKRHIVLFLKGTRVTESQKESSGWKYTESALWFLPKNNYYNAIVLFKKNIGNYYYINMASKPIFEDNTIKFIDYDLDIKCYPQKELQVVDREEFTNNAYLMKYPEKLKKIIFQELNEVISIYNNYEYFFNNSIIEYYLGIASKDKLISEKTLENFIAWGNKKIFLEEREIFNQFSKNTNKKKWKNKI
ncbi:DUF402 domain-containing protein [Mycoplasmopsis glycophila]|uniref:Protein of uncharacterized function (DUF402) n=1 Tax=Mycoplasmopsis glycophila TaxID=171285 RepID=A0A449AWJ8_9BACT|nr:DUF402 domain-containing protein [Mycoplasmopsis glycophila]VEU71047.1 Protein of uncharacterised function (DUF402) [Mycoplasmopsis glycophila]